MNKLALLINEFWLWTQLSKDKWKKTDIGDLPVQPTDFPRIGEICDACIALINMPLSPIDISLFLTGMAIDSEDEDILECCKNANDAFLYDLISNGITHPQSEARWQLAELLRRDIPQRDHFLNILSEDLNSYVRNRANMVRIDLTKKKDYR